MEGVLSAETRLESGSQVLRTFKHWVMSCLLDPNTTDNFDPKFIHYISMEVIGT